MIEDETISYTQLQQEINELQEETMQLRTDMQILWEIYGTDEKIQEENINATAMIISIAIVFMLAIIALIIGLKITGGI